MPQITLIVAKSTQPRRLTQLPSFSASLLWPGWITARLAVLNALAPRARALPLAAGPGIGKRRPAGAHARRHQSVTAAPGQIFRPGGRQTFRHTPSGPILTHTPPPPSGPGVADGDGDGSEEGDGEGPG